ncbi:hypothetical protein GVN21_18945 [Caulobacter sp. SLTY]|uniref:hypothetical protein n=1 Tax=Caulobacter sp. SLTY TaxID=2683262 RepID=UPI0014134E7D|nr:hypothetical protein [Caulobacter sp. SLTY]NBB17442.1 hypothetical protein [Caulobacter sp. SLTY]
MTFQTLYLAGVLIAFAVFFVTVTLVWFVNRLPDKAQRKPAQSVPARRPDVEPTHRQAA